MLPIGVTRHIDFRLVDSAGQPVSGRTLADWKSGGSYIIFKRDMVDCTDELSLTDYGDGRYTISYTPSAPGHDYFELYDEPTDIPHLDTEDILPANFATGGGSVIVVNQDFGGTGALKVTLPNPASYALQMYLSSDWENGRRSDAYAVGVSAVKEDGSWVSSISVPAGTYHIVLSKFGQQNVMRTYLGVQ